ncbi:MAG: SDR family oxidoreductase [Trueperaceae bacterium]|nr:SDR family oxidoreductase [Trueperaceae bacterium]
MPVALISGGAQGIGKGIAKVLLEHDYQVLICDLDEEAGQETVEELGEGLEFIQADVCREEDVKRVISKTVSSFGELSALVNNTGMGISKAVTELSLSEWNKVINTNLTSAFLFSKYSAAYLKKARGGIVNIASTRALMSEANTEAYAASKGGILALTHALAISLGPDVRVNAISPGWIDVSDWQKSVNRKPPHHSEADKAQHPVGRVGGPEDIAEMVYYLLSDKAGFISGQNFVIDGGMTKKMIYID